MTVRDNRYIIVFTYYGRCIKIIESIGAFLELDVIERSMLVSMITLNFEATSLRERMFAIDDSSKKNFERYDL